MTDSKVDLEAEAQKLRRHFKFTEDDLTANQSGVISEKQKKEFEKNEKGGRGLGIGIGIMLLVFGVILIPLLIYWIGQVKHMTDLGGTGLGMIWGGVGAFFGLLLLAFVGGGLFLIVSQFIKGKGMVLASVRGRARLEKGTAGKYDHTYYDLYINDHEFDGDGTMNKTIIEGAEYIVYYLDGFDEILSVELISV